MMTTDTLRNAYQTKDAIVEFTSEDMDYPVGLYKFESDKGCRLCTYKNKWIFPWKYTSVPINARIVFPDDAIGLIHQASHYEYKFTMRAKILESGSVGCLQVKARGIFPKRIHAGEDIAMLYVIPRKECYIINN